MRLILFFLLFSFALSAQNNIVKTVGYSYTNGAPTYTPAKAGSWLALDTVAWRYYTWNGSSWLSDGFRVQTISGCSAPAYTPTKFQSYFVINACTAGQGGPELYYWAGSVWLQINEAATVSEPALQVVKGTGSSVTSNANFVANDTSVAIRNNGSGFSGMLRIGSPGIANKAADFSFDVFSTSNYRQFFILTDSGYVSNVNSSARPNYFTGELNKVRLKLSQNGNAIFGDDNSSADIVLNAGTLKKKWSILTGSTPNPVGGGTDESLGFGMNIPGAPGYNSAYNSLIIDMETDYQDADNEYDEYYMTWIRSATGDYYRTALMGFFETGGVPRIENSYVGSFSVRSTTTLQNFSATPVNFVIEEDGKVLAGGSPSANVSKFEVFSDAASVPTMQIGSSTQNPTLAFYNGSTVRPINTSIESVNTAASPLAADLKFNTAFNGTVENRMILKDRMVGVNMVSQVPQRTFQIREMNFTAGQAKTVITAETNGFGGAVNDALGFGVKVQGNGGVDLFRAVCRVNPGLYSGDIDVFDTSLGSMKTGLKVFENGKVKLPRAPARTTETNIWYANSDTVLTFGPLVPSVISQSGATTGQVLAWSGSAWAAATQLGTPTDASAALEITSTTKGILPPRMTAAQRNAISSPATGLTLYCTDCTATDASTGVMQTYNGTTWKNNW